jgi:hypothetical protein
MSLVACRTMIISATAATITWGAGLWMIEAAANDNGGLHDLHAIHSASRKAADPELSAVGGGIGGLKFADEFARLRRSLSCGACII